MDKHQFKIYYLLSLILSIVGSVLFMASIVMFLFYSTTTLLNEIKFNNLNQDLNIVLNVIWAFLWQSTIGLIGIVLYFIGMIWNLVISFMRADTQDDHKLTFVVTSGWLMLFVLPVVGFPISLALQIWGWFIGGKDTLPSNNLVTS